jgi:hypothetical protein
MAARGETAVTVSACTASDRFREDRLSCCRSRMRSESSCAVRGCLRLHSANFQRYNRVGPNPPPVFPIYTRLITADRIYTILPPPIPMDSKYQYSSLFTSGLLMTPRPGSAVSPNRSDMKNHPSPSRRMSCNLTMPIIVNIPGKLPPRPRTTQNGPSSLHVNLSPQSACSSPVKTSEDSWDKIKRFGGMSSSVSERRMSAQSSNHPVSLASTSEQVEASEAQDCEYATYTKTEPHTRGQEPSQTYLR